MFEDYCEICEGKSVFRFLDCELCRLEEDHECLYVCVVCGAELPEEN